jgi:hypothetical protein
MPAHHGVEEKPWWRSPAAAATARILRGRFTGLMTVLLVLGLLTSTIRDDEVRRVLSDVIFAVLLFFAVRSVGRRLRVTTAGFALVVFVAQWMTHLSSSPVPRWLMFILTTAFLAYLTLIVLFTVLRDPSITADTIVGALCTYFLIGVTWGTAYSLAALLSPDAFSVSPALAAASHWHAPTAPVTPLLEYYSFTTLSTVGYGDISPLSGGARTLSALEGITGQLYLAVLIARLVGIHSARSQKS